MPKRLLLIGGGHSHVEVVRRWGLAPDRGVEVLLLSPDRHTPYSGMLPGHIAGHYRFEDCHIDLDALCRSAGMAWLENTVTGIDPVRHTVCCADGRVLDYDVVSVDTGSTPVLANIPGAAQHGVAVKPVRRFLEYWEALRQDVSHTAGNPHIAVVGAGAGGIELALAMHHRLHADGGRAQFTIISDAPAILAQHPPGVRRRFDRVLRTRGIALRLNAPVQAADGGGLQLGNGQYLPADHIVWVTGAAAPAWPRAGGLQTDRAGFIAVDAHLQSLSHPGVFAAGDVATMVQSPRPKSGVYAVRQGPPLAENLRRALRGAALVGYRPQPRALALISTGDRHAVASYGPLAFAGRWVWRWKDRIDRSFMARYAAPATKL